MEDNLLVELQGLQSLSLSNEWKAFVRSLRRHQEYLQKQVLLNVRKNNMHESMGCVSRFDECDKIIQLLGKRIEELKKEKGNGKDD